MKFGLWTKPAPSTRDIAKTAAKKNEKTTALHADPTFIRPPCHLREVAIRVQPRSWQNTNPRPLATPASDGDSSGPIKARLPSVTRRVERWRRVGGCRLLVFGRHGSDPSFSRRGTTAGIRRRLRLNLCTR